MGVRGEALQRVNCPFPGRDNGQQPARSRFNLRPGQDSVSANAELVRWTGSGRGRLWTCPRLVEGHCLLGCFILELYGAFVAKGRMPVDGIIKAVDISGGRMFSLLGATGGPNGQAFLLAVTRASRSASGLVTLPVGLPFSDFSRNHR